MVMDDQPPPPTLPHTNKVIEASIVRAQTEQHMVDQLQKAQSAGNIYNRDIEPKHDTWNFCCFCAACSYRRAKSRRLPVHDMWSRAVTYPGEATYSDAESYADVENPYLSVVSPYGPEESRPGGYWEVQRPTPEYHAQSVHETIALNEKLNREAQAAVDKMEPKSIWNDGRRGGYSRGANGIAWNGIQTPSLPVVSALPTPNTGAFSSFKSALGIGKNSEKNAEFANLVRNDILREESGRWPDEQTRFI
ncbi:hypothetical protein BDK51DRAFT_34248, partial [Blyttiomyces helicus]